MLIALACWAFSLFIPPTGRADPAFASTPISSPRPAPCCAKSAGPSALCRAVAVSWFWMAGAVALSLTPVVIRNATGAGIAVETAISALFALGIGIGSIGAALIRQRPHPAAPDSARRAWHGPFPDRPWRLHGASRASACAGRDSAAFFHLIRRPSHRLRRAGSCLRRRPLRRASISRPSRPTRRQRGGRGSSAGQCAEFGFHRRRRRGDRRSAKQTSSASPNPFCSPRSGS